MVKNCVLRKDDKIYSFRDKDVYYIRVDGHTTTHFLCSECKCSMSMEYISYNIFISRNIIGLTNLCDICRNENARRVRSERESNIARLSTAEEINYSIDELDQNVLVEAEYRALERRFIELYGNRPPYDELVDELLREN